MAVKAREGVLREGEGCLLVTTTDNQLTGFHALLQDSLVIVTNSGQGGQLPSVEDRGQELNGSSYPSLGNGPHAPGLESVSM